MKTLLLLFACVLLANNSSLLANDEESTENASSIVLSLAQDPSFGFYPFVNGSVPLNSTTDFTFYGIFWTQDALAGNKGGLGLLTEFGVGLNFKFAEGAFYLNPNLGIGNGKFQSGGGRHVFADNLALSLFAGYSNEILDLAVGGIYWKGFRREEMITPYLDQIEYTFNSWVKANNWFAVGLYFDHFLITEDDKNTTDTYTGYFWVGPAFKFTAKSGASMWFTFGPDFVQSLNDEKDPQIQDYYKLVASFPF